MLHCCPKTDRGMQLPMSDVAVLVIDMLNTYEHEDADVLARNVADIVDPLAKLVSRVRDRDDVDLVYVNDNYGDFYASSLDYLLRRLETHTLILTGQVTEQCILYSALDAYVRHFSVVVPPDAVAHIDPELSDAALTMMAKNMHAEIVPTEKCLG